MIPSNDFVKNFHNMVSGIESWRFRTRSLCGLALYYSFECKSLARAQRDIDDITNKIHFADFCDFTVTTTRRKSLPFATSVDWESLGKFDGEDVLQ